MLTKESLEALDYMLKPRWAWFHENNADRTSKLDGIKFIITISRHIRHNILITPYKTKAQVWSLTEKGVRLTSILKEKNEEIMAFSSNYKFLATFVEVERENGDTRDTREVNVYNVKSGLFLYKLIPKRPVSNGRKFEVSYVRFCSNERYLVMVGLEKSDDEYYEQVDFEAWHIESEQSIYSDSKSCKISLCGNKTFAPFVMVRKPGTPRPTSPSNQQSPFAALTRPRNRTADSEQPLADDTTPTESDSNSGQSSSPTATQSSEDDIYALYIKLDGAEDICVNEFITNVYGETNCIPEAVHSTDHASGDNVEAIVEQVSIGKQTEEFNFDMDINNNAVQTTDQQIQKFDEWIVVAESNLEDLPDGSDARTDDEETKKTTCYVRQHDGKAYLLQFGKYLVQLWSLQNIPEYDNGKPVISGIDDLEELLFIHAYKASNYGFTNTFRESWSLKIATSNCISFKNQKDGNSIDRIIAKITMDLEKTDSTNTQGQASGQQSAVEQKLVGPNTEDFSAELFIPFKEIVARKRFAENSLHVHLRSSCQALHYLSDLKHTMEKKEVTT
jgi:hypothetical protein